MKPITPPGPPLSQFLEALPARVYCGRGKIFSHILRPKELAAQYAYIQPNTPWRIAYIVFDVDHALTYEEFSLAGPSWAVLDKQTHRAHVYYAIQPVYVSFLSNELKALLKDVITGYKRFLRADKAITTQRQLSKNPLCSQWDVWAPEGYVYTLSEMADSLPGAMREYIRETNAGKPARTTRILSLQQALEPQSRNVTLFHYGRSFAYPAAKQSANPLLLRRQIEDYVTTANKGTLLEYFSAPLPHNEVTALAVSIARWSWSNRHKFSQKQQRACNEGVMGFPRMRGLTREQYDKETARRRSLAGDRTSSQRRAATMQKLEGAYQELAREGIVTQQSLSAQVGISQRQIRRYWAAIKAAVPVP